MNIVVTPVEPDQPEGPSEAEVRADLDARCLAARRSGATYREIAERFHVSIGRAHRGCDRARQAEPTMDPVGVRKDLDATLDRSVLELSAMIADRTTPPDRKIRAVHALVLVVDRKAKLHGADAPVVKIVKVEEVTPAALENEQRRIEAELAAAGFDISTLPSVEDVAALIDATATVTQPALPSATPVATPTTVATGQHDPEGGHDA